MNKQLRMHPVFNIFIIILGVGGIIAAVFLSWMGYQNNKIPEVYTDQQIVNQVMQDYSKDGFKEGDIQNISVKKSDDNRSFSATVDLVKETEICQRKYSVNYSYGMVDGCWVEDEGAEEFICQEPEWLLQGTSWSAETEEGIEYYISFLSSTDAIINVTEKNIDDEESDDDEENADGLYEENVDELYEEDDEAAFLVKDESCQLIQVGNDFLYTEDIQCTDGTTFTLEVNEDTVKINVGNGKEEIILERE